MSEVSSAPNNDSRIQEFFSKTTHYKHTLRLWIRLPLSLQQAPLDHFREMLWVKLVPGVQSVCKTNFFLTAVMSSSSEG